MNEERLVIVDGVRTPFTRMGTTQWEMSADDLGQAAVKSLLAKTGIDPGIVDEVIFGCVGQPVDAANVSRIIALRAGLPNTIPAITVHRNCASGFEALTQAWQRIQAGDGEVFIVGGAESMSNYPLIYRKSAVLKFAQLNKAKTAMQRLKVLGSFRPSDFSPRVGLLLGLTDPVCGMNMGQTAELLARENDISREAQDAFAIESHQKALAATERLAEEIAPTYPPKAKNPITADNGPRDDQTPEVLAKLKPVFEKPDGTVTAANASQVTDGAVAMLVTTEARAQKLRMKPLGYLRDYAYAGCDPSRMGLGPLYAIAKAEARCGLGLADADFIEINEAFAAQVLACTKLAKDADFARRELGRKSALGEIPDEKLNVNGGSIALGHPVGATGARLVLTALKELKRRKTDRALVSLCVGGGQGGALWLERK